VESEQVNVLHWLYALRKYFKIKIGARESDFKRPVEVAKSSA
jgi:hypothetical protein